MTNVKLIETDLENNMVSFDSINFPEVNRYDVTLTNFKASSKKTEARLIVSGETCNIMVEGEPDITSDELLDCVRVELFDKIEIDQTVLDNVDEELVSAAGPMKSMNPEEILVQQGFVKGAVVKRCVEEWDCNYGIFTGQFYQSSDNTVGLVFTDGNTYHQDYCTLVDDVNKEILRMVEVEKNRILNDAYIFTQVIDKSIEEIVYG